MLMNMDISATFSGGKQSDNYCQVAFETGENLQGVPLMVQGINLIQMFKEG